MGGSAHGKGKGGKKGGKGSKGGGKGFKGGKKSGSKNDDATTPSSAVDFADAASGSKPSVAGKSWYDVPLPLKKLSLKEQVRSSESVTEIQGAVNEARNVHWRWSQAHREKTGGDKRWMEQLTKAGTAADRIAAISMQLSTPEHVPYKLSMLGDLVSMTGHSGHSSRKATDALIELFTEKVMPDRRLKAISTRNFKELPDDAQDREKVLFYWHTEDQVKGLFGRFLETLKEGTNSAVENVKGYCIKALYLLLSKVPEEERSILTLLVNKMGDAMPKMATRAAHYLLQLLKDNPTMRGAVVKELESFLFRKNNPVKAQHYAVTVLSQIMLSRHDADLPQKLLEIYFACFSKAAQTENLDNRLVNSLLTGIRRAFPFSQHKTSSMEKYYTPLFSIAAVSAFPHRVAALTILHQVVEKGETQLRPRFYNSLYALILASPLNTQNMTSSKLALFFSLLFKSLKMDDDDARVVAFVHRLLATCLHQRPSYVCGALFLISEVLKVCPQIHPHVTGDGALVAPSTTVLPARLSGEAADEDDEEAAAAAAEKANGDALDAVLDEAESASSADEVEGFGTVTGKKRRRSGKAVAAEEAKKQAEKRPVVRANVVEVWDVCEVYDPNARNPCAARADTEYLWVLDQLAKHFHPSVAAFAQHVRQVTAINYEGDPLEDFTLQAFLDAFSFKNPKKKHAQTIKDTLDAALRRPTARRQTLMHDPERFTDLPINKVQIQDAFFYKYFAGRKDKILEMQKQMESDSESDEDEDEAADSAAEESEEAGDVEELASGEEDEEAEEGEEVPESDEEEAEAEAEAQDADADADADAGSDELPAFMKKYMRFDYDKMGQDKNVIADMLQDKVGVSDEAVDTHGLATGAKKGDAELEALQIDDEDLRPPTEDDDDGSDSDDDAAQFGPGALAADDDDSEDGPDFEAAVRAGADAGDDDDASLDSDMMAEMSRGVGGKAARAVPEASAERPAGSDDGDMDDGSSDYDLGGRGGSESDSEYDGGDSDSSSDGDGAPAKKKRKLDGHSKAFDVTKGKIKDWEAADPSDFASLIERGSKIGTTKYDQWLESQEKKGMGDQRRKGGKGKGGGKGGGGKSGGGKGKGKGGGKGSKGGKKGGKKGARW